MLTAEHMNRLDAMWRAADKLPCLVLLGDFWQLPSPERPPSKASDSLAWPLVKIFDFEGKHRCKDPKLQRKLDALRTSVPSVKMLKKIANKTHRAWTTYHPTAYDVLQLMRDTDERTTMVTCTRRGAAMLNELALDVFFRHRHQRLLGDVPFDFETNPDNYDENSVLKEAGVVPVMTTIFEGMRLVLTRNLNKRNDFVNGMLCTLISYDADKDCIAVRTETGKVLAVPLVTEQYGSTHRTVTTYPCRLGYACTVPKLQGQTVDHITLFLDAVGCRAAGYVALSRLRSDEDYLIAGPVSPRHFTPAM